MERADVDRALRVLKAAYPSQTFEEDSATLYADALAEKIRSGEILYAVVTDWITERTIFPKIADLLEACGDEERRRANRERAIVAGQASPRPGMVSCANCGDSTWELSDREKDGRTIVSAIPCRACRPTRHEDWRDGHADQDHDFENCDWILCQVRAKSGKKRGRGTPKNDRVSAALADVGDF